MARAHRKRLDVAELCQTVKHTLSALRKLWSPIWLNHVIELSSETATAAVVSWGQETIDLGHAEQPFEGACGGPGPISLRLQ